MGIVLLAEKFKVGDELCGCVVIEIHIEPKNNYAVVKCNECGKETKRTCGEMSRPFNCWCHGQKALRVRCEERANSGIGRVHDIPIGTVVNGRVVIGYDRKRGDDLIHVECPKCLKRSYLNKRRVTDGHLCSCSMTDKRKATNVKNHGQEYPEAFKEKAKATNLEKYGVPCHLQAESVKEKIKETVMERYGVEFISQSTEIRAKAEATCLEKYGVKNILSSPDFLTKAMETRANNDKANRFRSKAELEIASFIEGLGLSTAHRASGGREIDVFVPEKNIGIEFNGYYFHRECLEETKRNSKGKPRNYHIMKTEMAKAEGIELLHIWEGQWKDRRCQVENFLRSKLGMNKQRVGVRKCNVVQISKETARYFCEQYHIQGSAHHIKLAFGAYFDGDLIAVVTFSPHHREAGKTTLSRLCSKSEWTCSGFLGKTIKMAYSVLGCPIITWVDRCLSDGKSYMAAGFAQDGILPIDYFYYNDRTKKVIPKQCFRKIDERTEAQRAIDEGLVRIWDCGKIRFIYGKSPKT